MNKKHGDHLRRSGVCVIFDKNGKVECGIVIKENKNN